MNWATAELILLTMPAPIDGVLLATVAFDVGDVGNDVTSAKGEARIVAGTRAMRKEEDRMMLE